MEMPTRFIESELWREKWFRASSPNAKLLYLYLNGSCDIAGFYERDDAAAAFHIGITENDISAAEQELLRNAACGSRLETNGQYLWLSDFVIRQRNYPFNPASRPHQGIIRRLEERRAFSETVGKLLDGEGLPNPYASVPLGLFGGEPTTKKATSRIDKKLREEWFLEFWTMYPKRRGKGKAEESFNKKVRSKKVFDAVMAGLAAHVGCKDWIKESGKYIPLPATWLNQRRWEDEPEMKTGAVKSSVESTNLWSGIATSLKAELSDSAWLIIAAIVPGDFDGEVLTVYGPEQFTVGAFTRRFLKRSEEIAAGLTGKTITIRGLCE